MKKVNIALSGGGARGFAHIGALQALYEKGFEANAISGTSAGSLVGTFLADGYTPNEIHDIFQSFKFKKSFNFKNFKSGLLSSESLFEILNKNIRAKKIEDLKILMHINVTELDTGERTVLTSGNIIESVIASCSIPFILEPVKINNILYIDGGVSSNFPADVFLTDKEHETVGISVNPISKFEAKLSMIDKLDRMVRLTLKNNLEENKKHCKIFIEPAGLEKYRVLDNDKFNEIVKLGYEYTKQKLENL